MLIEILRWVHVIGATILLGTGAGIAFFMVMAHRTGDAKLIAHTASIVVIADFVFTASAVIVQPVTGVWLALEVGWPLTEGWVVWSIALYLFVGCFWLPVVVMQTKMRDLACAAAEKNLPLPPLYHRLYRLWFAFGFPAFFAVLGIVWLMVARPALSFL